MKIPPLQLSAFIPHPWSFETCLWLELLQDDCGIKTDDLNWLLKESNELIAIFVTMSKNVKKRVKR